MTKTLLKFSRPACPPCQMVSNYLNEKEVVADKEVNVYEDAEIANKYGIQSVPVLILLDGEDVEEMVVGYNPDQIDHLINKI